jgi:hypothetical protein
MPDLPPARSLGFDGRGNARRPPLAGQLPGLFWELHPGGESLYHDLGFGPATLRQLSGTRPRL